MVIGIWYFVIYSLQYLLSFTLNKSQKYRDEKLLYFMKIFFFGIVDIWTYVLVSYELICEKKSWLWKILHWKWHTHHKGVQGERGGESQGHCRVSAANERGTETISISLYLSTPEWWLCQLKCNNFSWRIFLQMSSYHLLYVHLLF